MKRTSQPKKRRRQRVHGFLERAARAKRGVGSHILQKRRAKGRKKLAPTPLRARGRKAVAA